MRILPAVEFRADFIFNMGLEFSYARTHYSYLKRTYTWTRAFYV